MKIHFLGTGTSLGIPVIGCKCATCQSNDPRDKRLRCSVYIEIENVKILIDIGPDFRYQMLRAGITDIDALLITHAHSDHIAGLEDIRPFNFKYKASMPIYAMKQVNKTLRKRYDYIFEGDYPGAAKLELNTISKEAKFSVKGIDIQPIEVIHGQLPVLAFRFGDFTYATDVKTIAKKEMDKLRGTKTLVLSALHHGYHHSHLTLEEALDIIEELKPERTFLTHLSHRMGPQDWVEKELPPNVFVAYDGLVIES